MLIPETEACVSAIFSFHGMHHAFGFKMGTGQGYKEKLGTACPSVPVCPWEGRNKGVEAGQTWEELLHKNLKSFCPRYSHRIHRGVSVYIKLSCSIYYIEVICQDLVSNHCIYR